MITITNIEQYTNDIRERLLDLFFGDGSDNNDTAQIGPGALAHAFDRATVAALFKASQEPAARTPPPMEPNDARVKPGSMAAKARAVKAAATRRANIASRNATLTTIDSVKTAGDDAGRCCVSTRVAQDEWPTLVPVPNYSSQIRGMRCDIDPGHGKAETMLQTPDHRALVVCSGCLIRVLNATA